MQNVVQDIEAGEITGLQTLFATALMPPFFYIMSVKFRYWS